MKKDKVIMNTIVILFSLIVQKKLSSAEIDAFEHVKFRHKDLKRLLFKLNDEF